MIYSADAGLRKVAGIKLDQATGEMKVMFVRDDARTTFQPLIGPLDKRVLLLTDVKQNVEKEPAKAALFTANYKEQLTWRDAATGKIIAASDFFEPLSIKGLTPPGVGGREGFLPASGHAVARAGQGELMAMARGHWGRTSIARSTAMPAPGVVVRDTQVAAGARLGRGHAEVQDRIRSRPNHPAH